MERIELLWGGHLHIGELQTRIVPGFPQRLPIIGILLPNPALELPARSDCSGRDERGAEEVDDVLTASVECCRGERVLV